MGRLSPAKRQVPVYKLLLVEDDPSDAFLVESLLGGMTDADYQLEHVRTQSGAILALAQRSFDACLLDMSLPDASGFSALVDIQEKAPDMPILILTGLKDEAIAKRAVSRGAQDYLLKDEMKVEVITRSVGYAIERKRMEKDLFIRANHDGLTGLANRELFLSRLEMALARVSRTDSGVAVLFIDLDRFKPINDAYGHDAGDEALKMVAERLRASLRTYDTPARLGGDEFAALLEGIHSSRDAATVAQKIGDALVQPMFYQQHRLVIGASIGIAYIDEPAGLEEVLQHADAAMYHAKKEGNTYRFYSADMQQQISQRIQMEEELRIGIAADEIRLYYQPYVALADQKILGVEALLRWAHPDRGLLSAREFLPVVDSARMMPEISAWITGQLRRDIGQWNAEGLPPMEVAINLSESQLDDPRFLEWITPLAQKDFLEGHRLAAEISEEAILKISGTRFMTLAKLHELEIALHLDRCATNALPLTVLTSVPFSLMKVDASLVQKLNNDVSERVLISSVIILAHHLGIQVGAVGVETARQMEWLAEHACDIVQGLYTAEPMTAQQLAAWIKR